SFRTSSLCQPSHLTLVSLPTRRSSALYAQQPAAAEPHAAAPAADASEQGAPPSDPALHPHDPYAVAADAPRSNPLDIDAEPAPQQTPPEIGRASCRERVYNAVVG